MPRNTRSGARKHVAAHYDLGNDLFELFLDETMTYSCAVFDPADATSPRRRSESSTSSAASSSSGPDDHVLEIGTGWGSFALHAAGRYGCRVTTTTISAEQHATRRRAGARGRPVRSRGGARSRTTATSHGRYDKLVSIEMIEAVGWQYFDEFFQPLQRAARARTARCCSRRSSSTTRAYEAEKASRSFIRELVFPSGCLPSLAVIDDCVRRVTDMRPVAPGGHHPALPRDAAGAGASASSRRRPSAGRLGYDRRFRRLWELYFAYCEGGFRERRIRVVQLELAKPATPHRARVPRPHPGSAGRTGVGSPAVAELRFRVGAIFPADNPTARYVMAISIVLGDLRTAAAQAARTDVAEHERLYFRRLLALHVREGLCLAVTEHRERDDVRRFVAILPDEAQAARAELEQAHLTAPDDGSFSCSRLTGDSGRLAAAMERLAEVESGLSLADEERRADYADLVVETLAGAAATDAVVPRLLTFLEHAEAAWLRPWRG